MMGPKGRRVVYVLMLVFFLASAGLSEILRPGHAEYIRAGRAVPVGDVRAKDAAQYLKDTSFQALMPTLLGVREVLASLLWIQADDYFHRGEYRPIIRMVRQITTIDPHQIDVYATGAWHMAYNFMDKRLIQDGVQFLEEGARNNDSVYDLFFELGYMHYDKTKDYPKAIEAYQKAATKATTTGKVTPPSYVRHQLAHATERSGNIDAAIAQWQQNIEVAQELIDKGEAVMGPSGANIDAAYHNHYITRRRRNERLAALAERDRNQSEALRLWQGNVDLADEWLTRFPKHPEVTQDRQRAVNEVDRLRAGRLRPQTPAHISLGFTITRVAPRKLQIEGDIDVLDLSRVHVRFHDKDYEERIKRGFDFKMANCSLEWENVSVNQGKFRYLLNLDRDPADMGRAPAEIYPLKADEYELSITYNPRFQAAFIQDRYGWNGEGLTADPELLVVDHERAATLEGKTYPLRMVRKSIILKREDILGEGKKVLATFRSN